MPADAAETEEAPEASPVDTANTADTADGPDWLVEPAGPAPRGRNLRVGTTAIVLLVVGVLGVVLVCGGVVGVVDKIYPHMTPRPDVSSQALLAARAKATQSIDQTLASVPFPGAVRLVESSDEACFQGQHGLTRRDDFNHVCTTRRTIFYSAPSATLRNVMIATGDQLGSTGWQAGDDPVLGVLAQDSTPVGAPPYSSWAAQYGRGADFLLLQFGSAGRSQLISTGLSQQKTGSSAKFQHLANLYSGIRYWENDHQIGVGALLAALNKAHGDTLIVLSVQRTWFSD